MKLKLTEQTEKKIFRILKENPEMEAAVFLRRGNCIFITQKNRLGIFKPDFKVMDYYVFVRLRNDPEIIDDYFREITEEMEMLNKWSDLGYWDYTIFYKKGGLYVSEKK